MTKLPISTERDHRFSRALPGLQLKVNSSSLGPLKACPRKYYYEIVCGLESAEASVHLQFGTLVHQGSAIYENAKIDGKGHDQNVIDVTDWALRKTWNPTLNRPWQSGHENKNRLGLVRTLVWYLDQYGRDDSSQPVVLPNGQRAIELPFEFSSGFTAITGEQVSFIGTLDRLVTFADSYYVRDIKTTGFGLGQRFFDSFTPDNQFSLYTIAGQVAFDVPVKGLIVDAIQVGATFSRCERGLVPRPAGVLDEWLYDAHYWLRAMGRYAEDEYWPQNDKSCGLYGGCVWRPVCGMQPSARDTWLQRSFRHRAEIGQEEYA